MMSHRTGLPSSAYRETGEVRIPLLGETWLYDSGEPYSGDVSRIGVRRIIVPLDAPEMDAPETPSEEQGARIFNGYWYYEP